jgi:predicted ribosome quality control (RQC) complex YloA/Tae2 family protein
MYKSYFFLNRIALELNSKLSDCIIKSIFSQEKDRLIIQFEKHADNVIEFSVNHSEPYITYRKKYIRAKRNTIDIFPELLHKKILSVSIADDDRIIKFELENLKLFFAIRGKFTNLYLSDGSKIQSFKEEDDETLLNIKDEFVKKNFINITNDIDPALITGLSIQSIREKFKFIGKELELEVKSIADEEEKHSKALLSVLNNLKSSDIVLYTDTKNNELKIGFDGLVIFNSYTKEYFGDLFDTLNEFLIRRIYLTKKNAKLKKIAVIADKELNRTLNRIEKLEQVIIKGPKDELFKKYANLILINLNKIETGAAQLICEDTFESGNQITIPLDNKILPQKNADKYFEKARNNLIEFNKSKELLNKVKVVLKRFQEMKKELNPQLPDERINIIMKELNIKDDDKLNKQDEYENKFKHYIISGKFHVYVGKDSRNNDLLTTKFAKQNDMWFHARAVSGSHVVLRTENKKEIIPKSVIKKAASLAAYYSKAKTAGIVPVSFTYKKYVVKRKGMPLGQVSLLKEDILLVKPEIPDECDIFQEK